MKKVFGITSLVLLSVLFIFGGTAFAQDSTPTPPPVPFDYGDMMGDSYEDMPFDHMGNGFNMFDFMSSFGDMFNNTPMWGNGSEWMNDYGGNMMGSNSSDMWGFGSEMMNSYGSGMWGNGSDMMGSYGSEMMGDYGSGMWGNGSGSEMENNFNGMGSYGR